MKFIFLVCIMLLAAAVALWLAAVAISLVVALGLGLGALRSGAFIPVIYNVRSLLRRRRTTAFTVLGMALVVFVFASVLMLLQGMHATLTFAGRADNALVIRKGSSSESTSAVTRAQFRLAAAADEIALDPSDGKPLADPQLMVLIYALRPGGTDTDGANVAVRGLSSRMLAIHDKVKLSSGRWFQPGTDEIVIGRALVGRIAGAIEGAQIQFARRSWTVVGVVDGGGTFDSEIWGDVEQFLGAFGRTSYSSVTVRCKAVDRVPALAARMAADPRLQLEAKPEQKYFEDLLNGLSAFLGAVGLFVAIVFSFGATLGAMISMYGQVAARTREVGTLRALGFRRSSVLVSFLLESMLLGLASGILGVALSSLMQLASFSTVNFTTFAEVRFRFALTPTVAVSALVFSALMGYAGGLLPAIRASRLRIVDAVRG